MKVAIYTAILSFLGAIVGVVLSSSLDQSNWQARFFFEQKRVILEKRMAQIERTVVVFNRAPTVIGLRASLEAEKQRAIQHLACLRKQNGSPEEQRKCVPAANPERIESLAKEIHELNAEMAAAMALNALYFGTETKAEVQKISKLDPWVVQEDVRQSLIDAMGRELNWFTE